VQRGEQGRVGTPNPTEAHESGLTVVKLLQAFKRYLKLEWIQEARWIVEDNLSFQEQSQGRAGQGRVRH
jgi:hypothetical protein